jgi:putative FmdB family regulatory protein
MPIYEYRCQSCEHEFEVWQKMSDPPVKVCPKCHARKVEKLISMTSFQLKGTGWYATDYGGAKSSPPAEKHSGDSASASSSTDKGGSDKASSDKGSSDKGSGDKGSGSKGSGGDAGSGGSAASGDKGGSKARGGDRGAGSQRLAAAAA